MSRTLPGDRSALRTTTPGAAAPVARQRTEPDPAASSDAAQRTVEVELELRFGRGLRRDRHDVAQRGQPVVLARCVELAHQSPMHRGHRSVARTDARQNDLEKE